MKMYKELGYLPPYIEITPDRQVRRKSAEEMMAEQANMYYRIFSGGMSQKDHSVIEKIQELNKLAEE